VSFNLPYYLIYNTDKANMNYPNHKKNKLQIEGRIKILKRKAQKAQKDGNTTLYKSYLVRIQKLEAIIPYRPRANRMQLTPDLLKKIQERRGGKPVAASTGEVSSGRKEIAKNTFKSAAKNNPGPKKRRDIAFAKDPETDYDKSQGIHAE
jgi:hypothetical protein